MMIDSENLRTASLYINNQLLSRGLLRDGQAIDFANPGRDEHLADTMGMVMSVVNDLILRRDRDAEHRESLSATLRALRAESLRQTDNLQRLQDKHSDARRKISLAEAAEDALRAQIRAAEANVQKLQQEAARTKKLVAETRASCANDVRKRDRQIDGLKKAVTDAGRSRGERRNPGITTIAVTGEVGGEESPAGTSTFNEGYDLRQETNEFLAELAKGLSDENETLLALVRRTSDRLKEMSGFEKGEAAGSNGDEGHAAVLPMDCQELTTEIEGILEHLRTILTNPEFVPLDEVVVREDEICRLRDGWEKMESRWKEAVHLIDGWRRRMAVSGRPVNLEELQMGLRLSPVRVQNVEETSQGLGLRLSTLQEEEEERSSFIHPPLSPGPEEDPEDDAQEDSLHLVPAAGYEMEPEYEIEEGDDISDSESSIFQDDVEFDELEASEPNVQILQQSTAMLDSPPIPSPPQITALEETVSAGNRGPAENATKSRKRPGEFTTVAEESTRDLVQAVAPPPPPHSSRPEPSPQKRQKPSSREPKEETLRTNSAIFADPSSSVESVVLVKPSTESSRSQASAKTTQSSRSRAQAKDSTPSRPPTRQQPSRATASSIRSVPSESENTKPKKADSAAMPPPPRPTRATKSSVKPHAVKDQQQKSPVEEPQSKPFDTPSRTSSPKKSGSRLPLPRNIGPAPQQSPLTMATIAAKLAASEREADAARVRAKLKAARSGKAASVPPLQTSVSTAASTTSSRVFSGEQPQHLGDPVKKDNLGSMSNSHASYSQDEDVGGVSVLAGSGTGSAASESTAVGAGSGRSSNTTQVAEDKTAAAVTRSSPRKETMAAGSPAAKERPRKRERRGDRVASRRRSTLNPWELQSLIQGDVNVPASPLRPQ